MIVVKDLTKKYGGHTAVDRISFSVEKGEIVGFLGKNGAGKSTTMKILSCYFPPTSGLAQVGGLDCVTQSLEVRRKIGYMPENVPLYTDMRVEEYLTYRAKIKGVPRRERHNSLEEVIKACNLKEVRRKLIGALSKGYRQRTGLAEAMIHHPELLILDEPTIGLDPNQIRMVRDLIRELGKKTTLLLSTHILREVELTATRVLMIHQGRIVASGTPGSLVGGIQTSRRFHVEVRGPGELVHAAIRNVVLLGTVTWVPGPEWHAFDIETPPERDIRPEIARAVVEGGWELRELREERRTLEDLFVQITTTNDASIAATKGANPAAEQQTPAPAPTGDPA